MYELCYVLCIFEWCVLVLFFFVFKQKTAYELRISDWSSDVCSSDLAGEGQARVILYHFTAREYLPSILEEGLTKGEVPTSAYGPAPNAVWFTSDGSPQGHGLSDEKILSPEEVQVMRRMHGADYPDDLMFPNKKAIRKIGRAHV